MRDQSGMPRPFSGKLVSFRLVSDAMGDGPCPEPGEIVQQRLSVRDNGHVGLSFYEFGDGEKPRKAYAKRYSLSEKQTGTVMAAVEEYFSSKVTGRDVIGCGSWEIELVGADGKTTKTEGALLPQSRRLRKISDMLRGYLGLPSLFCFDGKIIADSNEEFDEEFDEEYAEENDAEAKGRRCCFTGHRPEKLRQPKEAVVAALEKAIRDAAAEGFTDFISGMARGVDLWAAETVLRLRKEGLPIRLICAVPYRGFEKNRDADLKKRYDEILDAADRTEFVCAHYSRSCFQMRNEWMIDRSARLIAVFNGEKGGTKNTVDYARQKGIACVILPD